MRRAALAVLAAAVFTIGGGTGSALAITSSQLLSLEGQFMCVSCHQPLNQVYSAEAQDEKETLVQLVDQGLPMSEVKAQMVADYGAGVLAKPSDPWIYIIPIAAVLAALGLLASLLPRWKRRRAAARSEPDAGTPAEAAPLDAEDQERLDRELEAF